MRTPQSSTTAFDIIKNYLPAIVMIGAGFVGLVLTWKSVGDNSKGLETLKDQVQRQYGVQRDMNDKTNKEVDELQEWKARHEGYEQAKKDYNIK
jgi:hypothetical protein